MKKLFCSIWIVLVVFICSAGIKTTPVIAMEEDYYEELCEQIEKQTEIDNLIKEKYEQFISIEDGKYVFNYTEEENEIPNL